MPRAISEYLRCSSVKILMDYAKLWVRNFTNTGNFSDSNNFTDSGNFTNSGAIN
jgi:hypothetical protein